MYEKERSGAAKSAHIFSGCNCRSEDHFVCLKTLQWVMLIIQEMLMN